MNDDLKEALEALHDFREFWFDQVTQTRLGAGPGSPMWTRVADILDKHGMNDRAMSGPHANRYCRFDPAYIQR